MRPQRLRRPVRKPLLRPPPRRRHPIVPRPRPQLVHTRRHRHLQPIRPRRLRRQPAPQRTPPVRPLARARVLPRPVPPRLVPRQRVPPRRVRVAGRVGVELAVRARARRHGAPERNAQPEDGGCDAHVLVDGEGARVGGAARFGWAGAAQRASFAGGVGLGLVADSRVGLAGG